MKYIFLILVALLPLNDPLKIGKINAAKTEAKNAFAKGDYKLAIKQYRYLIDSLEVSEDEVRLNLANSYYLEKDTANALSTYQAVSTSAKKEISSKALNQLGMITNEQGKAEEALNYFKQAVKADPRNDDARYNYEMLKKKLDEKKKQEQNQQNKDQQNKDQKNKDHQQNKDQQNKDQQNKNEQKQDDQKQDQQKQDQENKDQKDQEQQNKDQQNKDEKNKEEQKKDQQQDRAKQEQNQDEQKKDDMRNLDREKLEQMKMSEEKARMILEAMRNQEKQYLQQLKRKATQPRDKNKPDW